MVMLVKKYIVEVLVTTENYTSVRQFVFPEDEVRYNDYRTKCIMNRTFDSIECLYGHVSLILECSGHPRDPVAIGYTTYDSGVKYERELLRHEVEHFIRWHQDNDIRFILEWLPAPER